MKRDYYFLLLLSKISMQICIWGMIKSFRDHSCCAQMKLCTVMCMQQVHTIFVEELLTSECYLLLFDICMHACVCMYLLVPSCVSFVDCVNLCILNRTIARDRFELLLFHPALKNHPSPFSWWSTTGQPVTATQTRQHSQSSQENDCCALKRAHWLIIGAVPTLSLRLISCVPPKVWPPY